jgi:hypothetical protein
MTFSQSKVVVERVHLGVKHVPVLGFAHVVPVSITDLNNFLRRKGRLSLSFSNLAVYIQFGCFSTHNASVLGLINQSLGCSRVAICSVARIVPMCFKEMEMIGF